MSKKFNEQSKLDLFSVNEEVLAEWDKQDLFHRSMSEREGCPEYVFYEGPPSANGHPGIHHVMARTIKDVFCRYKTMQGFLVKRKAGWDTHGLPVELSVEKELGITKEDIGKNISIEEYNKKCRENVMMFTEEWTRLSHLMGYWVDMEHPYITYENSYIETLWWLLKQLYQKGLLYKGYTIQPYSPAAGTGLSSHELNLPGCYREVKDTTATVMFRILDPKPEMAEWGEPNFIAWTTTPWTLPSNCALCVGPKITYVCVQTYNPYSGKPVSVVLAKDLVSAYFKPEGETLPMDEYKQGDKIIPYRVTGEWKGTELAEMHYEQILPYVNPGEGAFRVILGDYVTTEDGTGLVHIAGTFGADDAFVSKQNNVPAMLLIDKKGKQVPMVDPQGRFYRIEDLDEEFVRNSVNVERYAEFAGRYVKNAYDDNLTDKDETLDISLCMDMKARGQAFRIEKHVHSYPHCWRTDKPVLYYPLDSWFIRSTAAKERMMELNKTITWKPESTGTGRFGKWLENLNDWNLSRSRFWGTPLPIWRNDDGEEICIGSISELYDEIEKSVHAGIMKSNPLKDKDFTPDDYSKENYDRIDLHRPYVDDIVLVSPTGKPMHRETDLIDVWFDSGSMPYAQLHYPFENKELIDSRSYYPADFIAEGVDQTRGWFFTLHAIATMVFDSVAFKNVISNGLVLDKKGEKMSKHLGNTVNPFEAINNYGSDPLRWYMITNSSPWDNLKFDEAGVQDVARSFFGKLFQTYNFFTMYANVDGFTGDEPQVAYEERPEIDRWILSELNSLIANVTTDFNEYEPTRAGRQIATFVVENLSNWFVRLSRKRYWAGEMDADKLSAYQTLHTCLLTISKLMAPIAPFYADRLYKDLYSGLAKQGADSVHLDKFPVCDEALVDKALEQRMNLAQRITSMVLALRKKEHIIVRQPLQKIAVPIADQQIKEAISLVKQLILDEVNVKELQFVEGDMISKKVKCNFRVMGKKFGKMMKAVAAAVAELSQEDIVRLEKEGMLQLVVDNQNVSIEREDVEIVSEDMPGWTVEHDGTITVALDLTISDELKREGLAREVVKRIQTYRKESGFEITDRITVVFSDNETLKAAVEEHKEYIAAQVLANEIRFADITSDTTFDFDTFKVDVDITKN
ncbi:isoleucine--tRNA ligase [Pseudoprevotella muciniphila]|uniref:Isoleucine--tRNA ligase n=1 Tax=Pseudoprevotella muciniphila TaxID=2133944 RepID=A0A5P8E3Z6_9BACT|nr:isoleucine--tRNA ligase [Pseudoprevotella muciniphila]QFQ11618.1 isoleucine--tRNA ligase [Pseudoprevotella muciniphila]